MCTLVMSLLGWERLTRAQIAERVSAYPRNPNSMRQQLIRDISALRDEGVEVHHDIEPGGDHVYWIEPDEFYLPELNLTDAEQVALAAAAATVELGNGTLRDALLQLGGVIDDTPVPLTAVLPDAAILSTLFDATAGRATVTFSYKDERRTVEPWAVLSQRGWWYLIGFDRDRRAQRVFRVDRAAGPVKVGVPGAFEVPAGFDPRSVVPAPWQLPEGEAVEAEVLVDAAVAHVAVAELGAGARVEPRDDGSVVVRMAVTHRAAFRAWVLGWLDRAEVLGPPELRADIVGWLESMA